MQDSNSLIEFASRHKASLPPAKPAYAWTTRARLFLSLLLVTLALGLVMVFAQPPVFRSTATLLTASPRAMDAKIPKADAEHAVSEQHKLLGAEVLQRTLDNLQRTAVDGLPPTIEALRTALSVTAVGDTNLVELSAEAPNGALAAALVNAWVDAYQNQRARDLAEQGSSTEDAVAREAENLGLQVVRKRQQLEILRAKHGIVSATKEDNAPLASLRGLNEALNRATDEAAKAKARVEAVRQALQRGEAVASAQDEALIAQLQSRAQELREQLRDQQKRYTARYRALEPKLKGLPEELAKLEQEIKTRRRQASESALHDAAANAQAAQATVEDIRAQLARQRNDTAAFTAGFAEQKSLEAELRGLEYMYREARERAASLDAKKPALLPPIEVIDRGLEPTQPIRPNYLLNAGLVAVAALLFALLTVVLVEFLTRRAQSEPAPLLNLSGVHLYGVPDAQLPLQANAVSIPAPLPAIDNRFLDAPSPRELDLPELRSLLEFASAPGRLAIGLLLSGLTPVEIANLSEPLQFDDAGRLEVPGSDSRWVTLSENVRLWASESLSRLRQEIEAQRVEGFEALIHCAALDAGLAEPLSVNAAVVRHTYIVFLVRQGLRLAELERVVGRLSAHTLASYGSKSSSGPRRSLADVQTIHPALL